MTRRAYQGVQKIVVGVDFARAELAEVVIRVLGGEPSDAVTERVVQGHLADV